MGGACALYKDFVKWITLQKAFSWQMVHTLVDSLSLSLMGVSRKPSRHLQSEILEVPGLEELLAGQLFIIPVQHQEPARHSTQGLLYTP